MSACRAGSYRDRQRPDPKAVLRLTKRDYSVIRDIALFGATTRSQLSSLGHFTSTSRANRRLRQLFDGRFLRRTQLASGPNSLETVYLLGPNGVQIAIEETGLDPADLKRQGHRLPERMFLEHSLGVLWIRLTLEKRPPGVQLVGYAAEPQCRHEYEVGNGFKASRRLIKPDGFVLFEALGRPYPFFIEFDRGHVSLPQMKGVFERYARYLSDGTFQFAYGHAEPFEVLVVTTAGERRISHLATLARPCAVTVRFAEFKDLQTKGFFGPIWRQSGSNGTGLLFPGSSQIKRRERVGSVC